MEMKKLLIPIMVIAILVHSMNKVWRKKNVYISVIAIVVFMFGMMKLSARTPSKNQEKEEDDIQ